MIVRLLLVLLFFHQANVFVHYKPLDHEENNRRDHEPKQAASSSSSSSLAAITLQAMKERYMRIGGHEQNNHDKESVEKHLQDIDSELERANAQILPSLKDPNYKFNPNGMF